MREHSFVENECGIKTGPGVWKLILAPKSFSKQRHSWLNVRTTWRIAVKVVLHFDKNLLFETGEYRKKQVLRAKLLWVSTASSVTVLKMTAPINKYGYDYLWMFFLFPGHASVVTRRGTKRPNPPWSLQRGRSLAVQYLDHICNCMYILYMSVSI